VKDRCIRISSRLREAERKDVMTDMCIVLTDAENLYSSKGSSRVVHNRNRNVHTFEEKALAISFFAAIRTILVKTRGFVVGATPVSIEAYIDREKRRRQIHGVECKNEIEERMLIRAIGVCLPRSCTASINTIRTISVIASFRFAVRATPVSIEAYIDREKRRRQIHSVRRKCEIGERMLIRVNGHMLTPFLHTLQNLQFHSERPVMR